MTPDLLHAVLSQRQAPQPDLRAITALLGPAQSYATAESSKSMRVNVRIRFDNGRQMSSEVVILLLDGRRTLPNYVVAGRRGRTASRLSRSGSRWKTKRLPRGAARLACVAALDPHHVDK